MSHQPVIDGFEFARAGSTLEGEWPVAEFERLRDALRTMDGVLKVRLQGIPEDQGKPALRLAIAGTLQVTCQRCLGSMAFALEADALLHLAASQDEVDAQPLEAEGPETIVAGREMPVRSLVEDEVLLAIPIAPRHPDCAAEGRQPAQVPRPSPFAGLKGMLGGTKH